MIINKYTYQKKLNYDEDPPSWLKLEDLQKIMFPNKDDMKNHSKNIINNKRKLWNIYRSTCYPK